MTVPRDRDLTDPFLAGGPLPPPAPRDANAESELDLTERGEDVERNELEHGLTGSPSHGLTDDDKDAARHDPGRQPRTYAPASERVPKPPAPGDERIIEQGLHQPESPEAAAHPGDRSDPSELR